MILTRKRFSGGKAMTESNELYTIVAKDEDSVVLMYPDNQLGGQLREFASTFSAFTLIEDAFFKAK